MTGREREIDREARERERETDGQIRQTEGRQTDRRKNGQIDRSD